MHDGYSLTPRQPTLYSPQEVIHVLLVERDLLEQPVGLRERRVRRLVALGAPPVGCARTYRREDFVDGQPVAYRPPPSRNPVPRTCVPCRPASASRRGRRRGHPSRGGTRGRSRWVPPRSFVRTNTLRFRSNTVDNALRPPASQDKPSTRRWKVPFFGTSR